VELMIAVVVLGILAAVAFPAYSRYIRRAKTSEAMNNVGKIYMGEVAYFSQHSEQSTASFVSAATTPAAAPSASKYRTQPTSFTGNSDWSAIGFSIDTPFYYAYRAVGTATDVRAEALGDLDGDGIGSTFSLSGALNQGEIQRAPFVITNEFE
jgi:Tfp pilus assembly protein PilE